jgi:hypothetical protein
LNLERSRQTFPSHQRTAWTRGKIHNPHAHQDLNNKSNKKTKQKNKKIFPFFLTFNDSEFARTVRRTNHLRNIVAVNNFDVSRLDTMANSSRFNHKQLFSSLRLQLEKKNFFFSFVLCLCSYIVEQALQSFGSCFGCCPVDVARTNNVLHR